MWVCWKDFEVKDSLMCKVKGWGQVDCIGLSMWKERIRVIGWNILNALNWKIDQRRRCFFLLFWIDLFRGFPASHLTYAGKCKSTPFFSELADYEKNVNRDMHRYNAYRNAAAAVAQHPTRITSGSEARQIKGVGAKIALKIDELIKTGKLEKLEKVYIWMLQCTYAVLEWLW